MGEFYTDDELKKLLGKQPDTKRLGFWGMIDRWQQYKSGEGGTQWTPELVAQIRQDLGLIGIDVNKIKPTTME